MVFSLQLLWITPSWHISGRLEDREAVGAEISPCSCQRLGTTQEQLPSFLPRKEGWSQTVGSSPKALLLQGCTWARAFLCHGCLWNQIPGSITLVPEEAYTISVWMKTQIYPLQHPWEKDQKVNNRFQQQKCQTHRAQTLHLAGRLQYYWSVTMIREDRAGLTEPLKRLGISLWLQGSKSTNIDALVISMSLNTPSQYCEAYA